MRSYSLISKSDSQKLPWSKFCFVCGEQNPHGLKLKAHVQNHQVILEHTCQTSNTGYRNIMHGGIGITLLDEVMTWAAILESGKICVAAELTGRFLKPVLTGAKLQIKGWVTQKRSKLILTEAIIQDENEEIYMKGFGKFLPMNDLQAKQIEQDFVFSKDTIQPAEISQKREK